MENVTAAHGSDLLPGSDFATVDFCQLAREKLEIVEIALYGHAARVVEILSQKRDIAIFDDFHYALH